MHAHRTEELATAFRCPVLRPGEPGYDQARMGWNARFDRRPALIARCSTPDDVRTGVDLARQSGIDLAVKGGGHSNAGHSTTEGGLLLDLSLMKTVEVDPAARTVRVGPGLRWGELDTITQEHGLATPGGTVSTVGVSGFTLGGGSGNLARQHGLAVDNLIAAEVVTADGGLVRASTEDNPDLFWGLCGGAGNFGVVTSFELRLHPVGPQVTAGQVMYPLAGARDLLRRYRDFMAATPDELQCYAFFLRVPPVDIFPEAFHGQLALDLVCFHTDPGEAGKAAFEPILGLGDPIFAAVGPQPYTAAQQAFDAGLPAGQRYESRAHYLDCLTDEAIGTIVDHVADLSGPLSVAYLEPLGGTVARVEASATAFPHRGAAYGFHIIAGWMDAAEDNAVLAWTRAFHDAMTPHAGGGVYVNLLGTGEEERVRAAYGDNWDRLVEVKRNWDPENLFRGNANIAPEG
jgi:FAD/FMN-containing dehydrogenase